MLWRQHLKQRSADDDTDIVGNATHEEQHHGQREAAREAETEDAGREARHREQKRSSGASKWRSMCQIERHHDRASRWCGAQDAETLRANVQDVRGEYGKKRFRAAEQYGKEIE